MQKPLSIPKYTIVYGDYAMETTTIKLRKTTKKLLDKMREYKNESYDEIICKMYDIIDEEGKELNAATIKRIEAARKRIKQGKFVTLEELRKRLGFDV